MSLDSVICFFQALTYFIAPITLSFIALNFWRKNGVRVQGSLSSCQSAYSEDSYFNDLLLENLKDRPVNILNIYIRVGNAYHIEIESYHDDPLILKPYEVTRVDLKPAHAYLINMKRVSFNKIIKSMRSKIIISTTTGRYEVKRDMKIDPAVGEYLYSRFMVVAQPITDDYPDRTIKEAKEQVAEEVEACPSYYPILSKMNYKAAVLIFRIKRLFGK